MFNLYNHDFRVKLKPFVKAMVMDKSEDSICSRNIFRGLDFGDFTHKFWTYFYAFLGFYG